MLNIINRSNLIGSAFYDRDGLYWRVDKMIDDTDEYLILLKSHNGLKELFSLKKTKLDARGYELNLIDAEQKVGSKAQYRMQTYLPIEYIKYGAKFLDMIKTMINKL